MLNYLVTIYLNPNQRKNIRFEFKKLVIKKNKDYYSFFTKFLYLLNKAKVSKENLIKKFRNRLIE